MPPSARPRPPSVDRLLAAVDARGGDVARDRATVVATAREVIADERAHLATNGRTPPRTVDELAHAVMARLASTEGAWSEGLVPVINATGVIVHTNLGRAPWPREAIEAARTVASGPLLLELDRDTGRRRATRRPAINSWSWIVERAAGGRASERRRST